MIRQITVAGRQRTVDLVPTPLGWSMLLDGRSYEVALEAHDGAGVAYVNGIAVPVTLPARARFGRSGGDAGNGSKRIVAPMPGRVIKVLVKPGDEVAARQPLVVVEAMKMENELRASGAGTVAEVKVVEGASVEANALLVVIA